MLHHQVDAKLITELILPPERFIRTEHLVNELLCLFRQRPLADHAEIELHMIEFIVRFMLPERAQVEPAGIFTVVGTPQHWIVNPIRGVDVLPDGEPARGLDLAIFIRLQVEPVGEIIGPLRSI